MPFQVKKQGFNGDMSRYSKTKVSGIEKRKNKIQ